MDLLKVIKNNPFTFISLITAAAVCGFTFRYSVPLAAAEAIVIILVTVFSLRWYYDDLTRRKDQVRALSESMQTGDIVGEELRSFPLPVLLVKENGEMIWFNTLFEQILSDFSELHNSNINSLFSFSEHLAEKDRKDRLEVRGDTRAFTVYPAPIKDGSWALYFTDDTVLKDIRKKYRLSRPAVILINADSLEQAEDLMPNEDYYALNSDIDKMIRKWFAEHSCVFRKVSDGRFVAITEHKHLQEMINTRFDIIDKIRGCHFGPDEVEITLSIGVGHSLDFKDCEEDAREALDMARGRGGDQVAIKNGENYEFFGGISSGREKRGKVKSRAFAAALDEYIENSSDVLIMGHTFSDFDCIGAAAGLVAISRAKGKNVHVITDRRKTMALPLIKMLEVGNGAISFVSPAKAEEYVNEKTILIIVDTMRTKLVEAPALLSMGIRTVVIDHHRMAIDHIEGNTFEFLEPYASSACEMVTELVQYSPSKPKLSPVLAQALLAGIMLDTKDYTLRVGVRTFDAASYLRSCKADTVAVRKLFSGTAEDNIQVNNIVNSAVYFDRYAISISAATGSNARLICSKAADALLSIENVDASFVVFSFGDMINISARSLGRINVQLVMEKLGGGGHHSMAAAQLTNTTLQETFDLLKSKIEEYLKENT